MHETKSDLRNVAEVGGNQAFACIDFCPYLVSYFFNTNNYDFIFILFFFFASKNE